MTPIPIAEIVIAALEIAVRAAPGFLAAFSSEASDEAALARAKRALDGVPVDPARAGIERFRESLRANPPAP